MKFLFKYIYILLVSFFSISSVFAIDAPLNLKIDSINKNTVNLSWDSSTGAYSYYLSYGKNSGGPYDLQTDYLNENSGVVSGLEAGNTYYFVVKALDENAEESEYSNEVAADIGENNVFALESVVANNINEIELQFSRELDSSTGAIREFKIYKKTDELDSFEVLSTNLNQTDNSKLNLILDRDLEDKVEYEVVVIAINDKNGNNIESGIDSIESFIVNEENFILTESGAIYTDTGTTNNEGLNSASESGVIYTDTGTINNEGLNSASESGAVNNQDKEKTPDGTILTNSDLEKTTLGAAKKIDSLPKTGPEHILLFILSIVLGALVFVFKYKRS